MDKATSFPAVIPVAKSEDESWSNYIRGVFFLYQKETGVIYRGIDLYIDTQVPLGGGLSSSASLEVSVATFLEIMFQNDYKIGKDFKILRIA